MISNFVFRVNELLSPDKVIFNFSSRVLTDIEKLVLSKRLKFVLPPRKMSLEKYLLNFEKLYNAVSKFPILEKENIQSDVFKNELRNLAFKSYTEFKKKLPDTKLSESEMNALKSLQRDRSILISKPDKGNGVVLMDKIDYKNKVNLIL